MVGIGAIISTIGDASTYATFDMAKNKEGTQLTVIGYLDTDSEMNYQPEINQFSFTAVDKDGEKSLVVYNQPKPQDFERSEEITMKGYYKEDRFVAEEILMKCPSKYNESNELDNLYKEEQ
jgi:cytochrome c-type biogenesis protein CcmE